MEKLLKKIYTNNLLRIHLIYGSVIVIFCFMFFGMNYLLMELGDEVQNINYALNLQAHINDNKLNYPLHNVEDLNMFGNVGLLNFDEYYFNRTINEFHELLNNNYYYEKNTYNDLYYAYIWSSYFAYNRDTLNLNFKYVKLDNKIIVIAYNETDYILADGKYLLNMNDWG